MRRYENWSDKSLSKTANGLRARITDFDAKRIGGASKESLQKALDDADNELIYRMMTPIEQIAEDIKLLEEHLNEYILHSSK